MSPPSVPICPPPVSQLWVFPAFLLGAPHSLWGALLGWGGFAPAEPPPSDRDPRDMTQDQEVLTAGVVQVGGEEDGVVRTPGEEKDRVGRGGGHPKAGGARWPRMPAPTNSSYRSEGFGWVGRGPPVIAVIGPPKIILPTLQKWAATHHLARQTALWISSHVSPKSLETQRPFCKSREVGYGRPPPPQQLWVCKSPSPTLCPPPPRPLSWGHMLPPGTGMEPRIHGHDPANPWGNTTRSFSHPQPGSHPGSLALTSVLRASRQLEFWGW